MTFGSNFWDGSGNRSIARDIVKGVCASVDCKKIRYWRRVGRAKTVTMSGNGKCSLGSKAVVLLSLKRVA